ncbi:MAG: right-handed parallel beta-helix repeat-containing protein [Candidatus Heimdallarchaeota archaeon]
MIRKIERYLFHIFLLIVLFCLVNTNEPSNQTNHFFISQSNYNDIISNLTVQAYGNNTIEINSNADFTLAGFSGSGTEIEPYILEDVSITNSSGYIIRIENTDAYFKIQNCTLNGLLGQSQNHCIYLINVTNGIIQNNTVKSSRYNIQSDYSYGNLFINNTFFNSTNYGLWFRYSHYNNVINNKYINCYHGVAIRYSSYNNTVSNNYFNNGSGTGIYASHSENVTIIENTITNCGSEAIVFGNVTNGLISKNNVSNTFTQEAIGLSESKNIIIQNNTLDNNFGSVHLQGCEFCKISGNWMKQYGGGNGIQISFQSGPMTKSVNNTVEDNYITDGSSGIQIIYTDNTTINNNQIVDCGATGIRVGVNSIGNKITNNLVNWTDRLINIEGNNTIVEWNTFFYRIYYPEDNGYFNIIRYNYYDWHISPDNNSDGFVDAPLNYTGTANNQDLYPLVGSSLLDGDGDGLTDFEEAVQGTDPQNPDSDFDNITDIDEINIYLTNPLSNDTDIDGLDDFEEVNAGLDGYYTNPLSNDTDSDLLGDFEEVNLGLDGYLTNPTLNDTDQDGLLDGAEYAYSSNPLIQDTDMDDLLDGEEVYVYGTSPTNNDTEGDGLPDGYEVTNSLDPLLDDADEDPDTDDLTNLEEFQIGTNPHNPDTDGDGFNDGLEIDEGTDPLDPNDFPIPPPVPLLEGILNDPESIIILTTVSIVTTATVAILTIRSFLSSSVNKLFTESGRGAIIADKVTATSQDKVKQVVNDVLEKINRYGFCPKCKTNAIGPICYLCGTTIDYDKVADLENDRQKSIPDEEFEENIDLEEE